MSSKYNRTDSYYNKAKDKGLKSRAYFKLEELDKKQKLVKRGLKIIDLGAWPGGWLQYCCRRVGTSGNVVGVDLQAIDLQLDGLITVVGDLYKEETVRSVLEANQGRYDLVLSDMSPKLTGIKESDMASAAALADLAIFVASKVLNPGGNIVIKLFKSADADEFLRSNRQFFEKVMRCGLQSTRKTSNEFYFVGLGFKLDRYQEYYAELCE